MVGCCLQAIFVVFLAPLPLLVLLCCLLLWLETAAVMATAVDCILTAVCVYVTVLILLLLVLWCCWCCCWKCSCCSCFIAISVIIWLKIHKYSACSSSCQVSSNFSVVNSFLCVRISNVSTRIWYCWPCCWWFSPPLSTQILLEELVQLLLDFFDAQCFVIVVVSIIPWSALVLRF